jgi:hypothetical protein
MRKIRKIVIEEKDDVYNMRPQLHALIVSPFGTAKSSTTKIIENNFKDVSFIQDDISKPAIQGSISKDGDYVPSILIQAGAKVLIIDEWNNIDMYAQQALLSVLENQRMNRSIGFKVKKTYQFKNKYVDMKIEENRLTCKAFFGCLAYAMEYPIKDNSQKSKALLSRFSPLFIEPTKEMMKAITHGDFKIDINDYSQDVDNVRIGKELYEELHTNYYDYIEEHDLFPDDPDDYGFITRALCDFVRIGIYCYLKENTIRGTEVNLTIDDIGYFNRNRKYIHTILLQFINPRTKGKIHVFEEMKKKYPNKTNEWYADRIGVSRFTVYDYNKKIKAR